MNYVIEHCYETKTVLYHVYGFGRGGGLFLGGGGFFLRPTSKDQVRTTLDSTWPRPERGGDTGRSSLDQAPNIILYYSSHTPTFGRRGKRGLVSPLLNPPMKFRSQKFIAETPVPRNGRPDFFPGFALARVPDNGGCRAKPVRRPFQAV